MHTLVSLLVATVRSLPALFRRRQDQALERFVGTVRRERLDPAGRSDEARSEQSAALAALPRVGGLHRRYTWREAA